MINNITSIQFVSEFECPSCGGQCREEHAAYIEVEAVCDGVPYRLGTMVGVPEHLRETMRAAGSGVRPYVQAWFECASDTDDLPRGDIKLRAAVESALCRAAWRLYREALDARSSEHSDESSQ